MLVIQQCVDLKNTYTGCNVLIHFATRICTVDLKTVFEVAVVVSFHSFNVI